MKETIKMDRKKDTANFVVFEEKSTRQVIYLSKATTPAEVLEAERLVVTVEAVR